MYVWNLIVYVSIMFNCRKTTQAQNLHVLHTIIYIGVCNQAIVHQGPPQDALS
jgi:hypothetical protein